MPLRLRRPSLRSVVIGAALVEAGLLLGLVLYLAISGKALLISLVPRERVPAAGPSPRLIVPVAGVRVADLKDSYGAARSGGRKHKGVDIMAPKGTPVVAAAAGVIVGRDSGGLGGIALYERDLDGRTVYYYAHLQGYRGGLAVGDLVRQGDVIGYVGATGNAGGTPHLHFAAFTVTEPNRWRKGKDLNPYPLLIGPDP
ncbi:MAG TPA: M23 family metallopeptidase [Longimicrobium sp.]|nr:M23 family metallopeptidase [Longimicrobium sp.]